MKKQTSSNDPYRISQLQHIILAVIATGGIVALAAIAPGIGLLFKSTRNGRKSKNLPRTDSIHRSVKLLEQRGFIKEKRKHGTPYFELTSRGRKLAQQALLGKLKIKPQKKWDRKWRVVIFDIEEYKRGQRNLLRHTLENIGFVQLQKSVWVCPYPCEEIIQILKQEFYVSKNVTYIVAEKIEGDSQLKRRFHIT